MQAEGGDGALGLPSLFRICRCFGSYCLAWNMVALLRWVQSEFNHADGPSHFQALGCYAGGKVAGGSSGKNEVLPWRHGWGLCVWTSRWRRAAGEGAGTAGS